MYGEIIIVFLLILLNGVFSLSELAVVSARKQKLKIKAEDGSTSAAIALKLQDDPGRFLSTVQIGITLISILTGVYSGAQITDKFQQVLESHNLFNESSYEVAVSVVVVIMTIATLIFGELLPKQLALRFPDKIACIVARPLDLLAKLAYPAVIFLNLITDGFMALFGIKQKTESDITQEEVKAMVAEGTEHGIFESGEQFLIEGIFRLSDRAVKAIMTPRQEVVWLDMGESLAQIMGKIEASKHSRYVVCEGKIEHPLGVVSTRDILTNIKNGSVDLQSIMNREPPAISPNLSILEALEIFKSSPANLALVVDEYGGLEGVLSLKDVLMSIVGEMPEHKNRTTPAVIKREDGSYLVDGLAEINLVENTLGIKNMADEDDDFVTIAGFVLAQLGELPTEGQQFAWNDYIFEIVDMDGNRIDKVFIRKKAES